MGSVTNASMDNGSTNGQGRPLVFTDQVSSEEFLKTLECPICLDIVVPPVVNCTSGHIICSLCRVRVDKCGLCGSYYTTIRNYPIEAILGLIQTRCRHSLCSQQMTVDKLREHLGICEYRPVACEEYSVAKCNGKLINFEDYPQHLMEVHKTRCKTSEDPEFQRINLSNALEVKWPIFLLSHRNRTFFLHRKSVFHHLLCWVSMMATEAEAEDYSFQLRIRHPYHEDKSMEWNIRAHSVHTSLDSVKGKGDCAFIPYEALIPYCERKVMHTTGQVFEFKWTMTIRIKSPASSLVSPVHPGGTEKNRKPDLMNNLEVVDDGKNDEAEPANTTDDQVMFMDAEADGDD